MPVALEQYLEQASRDAQTGDRLPPIRELMRRFGVSQVVVQRALDNLKRKGLVASQVGRGTFFQTPGQAGASRPRHAAGAPVPAVRSILLLRRNISIRRGRVLADGLRRCFEADGHHVLEVTYTDPSHARTILKGLPRFDACVVQSTFKTIPVELLAAMREKSAVLAVDGAALVGTDVDAVGMEWGQPLAQAVQALVQQGHRRLAFATTTHAFLALELGWRRFEELRACLPGCELHTVRLPQLPDEGYELALVDQLKARCDAGGRLPFSALVAWGIEDGALLRRLLQEKGWRVPQDLSVVLLGRTDLVNEHADFFETIGCQVADQIL
ncbi:MAG TPA: GntR family transcriptional regulator [Rubrivivax sp.]|nr:GntR family transcriptional regulator [Rubrivivax sp.]